MKTLLTCLLLGLALVRPLPAAPAPPMESLLVRAETVLIVKVVSIREKVVTFQVVETWRGQAPETLTFPCGVDCQPFKDGQECLLISQGDARYGAPLPVVERPMDCQGVWCGWTPLGISRLDGEGYADGIYSFVDGQPFKDGEWPDKTSRLKLSRIKKLVGRFAYDPEVNRK